MSSSTWDRQFPNLSLITPLLALLRKTMSSNSCPTTDLTLLELPRTLTILVKQPLMASFLPEERKTLLTRALRKNPSNPRLLPLSRRTSWFLSMLTIVPNMVLATFFQTAVMESFSTIQQRSFSSLRPNRSTTLNASLKTKRTKSHLFQRRKYPNL